MRVKERESWIANNVGKGGKKPSYSRFNKEFKGKERNPSAREFASMDVEEYHHYSATVDTRDTEKRKKDETSSQPDQSSKTKSNTSSRVANQSSSLVKNIVSKAVAVGAGSVMVVSTYQAIATPTYTTMWKWSADYASASLEFLDEDGTVVKEIPATVTITKEDATCTEEGTKTFNATVDDEDGNNYSDTHSETIDAHGHKLDNGKLVHFDDGSVGMVYECDDCHETFTIIIQEKEN